MINKKKPSKYKSKKIVINGVTFHSLKEGARFKELMILEKAGYIKNLELQPKFPMLINAVKICNYIADFKYYDNTTDSIIVEDVKGFKTPIYKLKKKMFMAIYPEYKFLET